LQASIIITQEAKTMHTEVIRRKPVAPTRKEILRLIQSLPRRRERKVLVGQQISHQRRLLQSSYQEYICGLETATGKAPAILGCSFRRTDPEFTPDDIALMGQLMIEHWNRGGLVSITPFFHSPWGGGANSIDRRPVWGLEALVDPGTRVYRAWHEALEQFAGEVQELVANGVVFIFRPFHECTGSWFWWGPKPQDEWRANQARFIASFKAVWRDIHDTLNGKHGLADHIIWAYTTANRNQGRNLSSLFPGRDYADLVGCSVYHDDVTLTPPGYEELRSCGLPVFLAECGRAYNPNSARPWSNMRVWEAVREHYPDLAVVNFWSSWGDNAQAIVDNADADRFMRDTWGIALNDVSDLISENLGASLAAVDDLKLVEAALRQKAQELVTEADRVAATIAQLESIDSWLYAAAEGVRVG
jgi:hypothetical protein